MSRYRAEVLGRVPYGLTHNDVYASFLSMMREHDSEAVVTKRRLAGNTISLIVAFKSEDTESSSRAVNYAATGVTGFSFDLMIREVK